jgi:hypothetical protein
MGDLRMLFAEDKDKALLKICIFTFSSYSSQVNPEDHSDILLCILKLGEKIVDGSFELFQLMYRPLLQEYTFEGLLKTSSHGHQISF